jgi:hypothetical protein
VSADGGGASVGDVDESRRVDDGGGQGGCGVLGPNGGDADVREVDECRRWDDGGGQGRVVCYALLRMRPLSTSCAEGFVVISCGNVDYDKCGWRDD